MNKQLLVFMLFHLVGISLAQQSLSTHDKIRLSEASNALHRLAFEPNDNTNNYDIIYNRLELSVDPAVAFISGDVTAHFRAKENLNQIVFDLADNMVVSLVSQRGVSLDFIQNSNDELVIDLQTSQAVGVLDSLTISYSGNPKSSGFGSFEQSTHNGDAIIWTLSEPYGAKGWWPCKQDLIDKIDSLDVYLTTPRLNGNGEEIVGVSNGVEKSQIVSDDHKTTHFRHRYPIPAYLVAIAATNYAVYVDEVNNNGNPFDIVNYVYPENLTSAQSSTAVTVDIMNFFSDRFEEYPFAEEKYGHAQFGWGGGMEHTTVSFMGSFNRGLIAHELAHQWFGNKITCGSWQDIWLNEGFATYLSGLVIEELDGASTFNIWKGQVVNSITSSPGGSVYVPASDTLSVGRVFNGRLSYNKGAMVLHMLRMKLGDDAFYQGLRTYLSDPKFAFGYAKTEDFKGVMESSSGTNLDEFFSDWVYNQGYPSYTINWSQNSEGLSIVVGQDQSDASVSFFEMDLPIRLLGNEGEILDIEVYNHTNGQRFVQEVDFEVKQLVLDPENDIVTRSNEIVLDTTTIDEIEVLTVYPNPFEERVNIQKPANLEITEIRLINGLGHVLFHSNYSENFSVKNLDTGAYFLQLLTNQGVITKSLLKK